MAFTDEQTAFLEKQRSAAMITIGDDGMPKVARVGVALVDGKLWSSGTRGRVRTSRLRRDPRCTVFVFGEGFSWLALETEVTLLDGPQAPAQNLRLFRVMQNRPTGPLTWYGSELDEAAFLRTMEEDSRLIYEFEVHRCYGVT